MERLRTVLASHRDALMQKPNVVGVGIGNKRVKGQRRAELAVVVLVEKKLPMSQLAHGAAVPRELEGAPTDVIEVGLLQAQRAMPKPKRPLPRVSRSPAKGKRAPARPAAKAKAARGVKTAKPVKTSKAAARRKPTVAKAANQGKAAHRAKVAQRGKAGAARAAGSARAGTAARARPAAGRAARKAAAGKAAARKVAAVKAAAKPATRPSTTAKAVAKPATRPSAAARAVAKPAAKLRLPTRPLVAPKASLSVVRTAVFAPVPAPAASESQGPSAGVLAIQRLIESAAFVPAAKAGRALGANAPVGLDVPGLESLPAWTAPHRARVRPVRPGVSVGHAAVTAGTLGAIVWDRASGRPLLLSNNHVLANATTGRDGRARKGDPVLQPGPADAVEFGGARDGAHGRKPVRPAADHPDVVARLHRFIPLRLRGPNLVDAAVAEPVAPEAVARDPVGLGPIAGVAPARPGITVRKSGRTTGVTHGEVYAIHASVRVQYPHGTLAFVDQVVCSPMSEPGDSGAVVVDPAGRAIGLVFAGSDKATLCNPMTRVLRALDVTLTAPGEEPAPAPVPAAVLSPASTRPTVPATPGPLAARALAILARD